MPGTGLGRRPGGQDLEGKATQAAMIRQRASLLGYAELVTHTVAR